MKRTLLITVSAIALGFLVATFVPTFTASIRSAVYPPTSAAKAADKSAPAKAGNDGHAHADGDGKHEGEGEKHGREGEIPLTEQQIATAKITVAKVGSGELSRGVVVPGTIVANANGLTHIPANVAGVLRDIRKQLGEPVTKGEILAVIESREIADAKSEYLAALRGQQLAQTVLRREKSLWDQRVSAEQDYIQARSTAEETSIRVELARQKLSAIGIDQGQIRGLAQRGAASLRLYEVRSQIAGRVIARTAELGSSVDATTALFTVADLSTLWVELTVSPLDLAAIKEGLAVTVRSGDRKAAAKLIFVSPVVNNETRSARAVALLSNADGQWRPGDYVQATLETSVQRAEIVVPRAAIQTVETEQVVFVRTNDGFEKREVVLGRGDEQTVEITFGLDAGETIAVTNSFMLKAELGKSEAEHAH